MTQVYGVHGVQLCETYLVNVYLPNQVVFHSVRATKGDVAGADVLIGMDIINMGDFAVTNFNGQTKFTFRYPSARHIDFVEEINKANLSAGTKGSASSTPRKRPKRTKAPGTPKGRKKK